VVTAHLGAVTNETEHPMYTATTTTPAIASTRNPSTPARTLWATGAVSGVAGSIAALATHAVAKAADVPLSVDGKDFPLFAFPQLTLISTVIGVVIAIVASRRSSRPRRTFVVVTVALTLLSLVAPLALDTDTATKVTLEIAHLVAAAVIIPAVAAKLAERRG
jgi:peptidoglycan/LPS O-acetylase OafA/YrhL